VGALEGGQVLHEAARAREAPLLGLTNKTQTYNGRKTVRMGLEGLMGAVTTSLLKQNPLLSFNL
jgi:hypothetical protein